MMDKLGIIAGGGALPRQIAEISRSQGREVFIIALEGYTDSKTVGGQPHAWVRLGAVGKTLELLRSANVVDLVLAGPVRRPSLADLRPDLTALNLLRKFGKKALGDDGLLRSILATLEDEGFRIVGADALLGPVLAEPGIIGVHTPDEQAQRDIERGADVLAALSSADIGQAAVIQEGLVLGVEAIEGTDALLARCGALRRDGPGGVLVKFRKSGQDNRVDLPTIGVKTIRAAAQAGLRGVAIEAGGTMIMERDEVIREADDQGLFVIAIEISR